MGDNLVLCVDRVDAPESLQSLQAVEAPVSIRKSSYSDPAGPSISIIDIVEAGVHGTAGEEEPLIQTVECRICQEEDSIKNLETPCACSGSLKFAHRKCVQRWCNEKGDITCEICHQPYQSGYTAPPPLARSEDATIDISGAWTIAGTPSDLHDPRLLAMAAAERHLLERREYDEYEDTNISGASFCRSAVLILMALLLLRHAMMIGNDDGDEDDDSTYITMFLLRVASFLLPCYIMAWTITVLQRRRQRQEAAAIAAAEVAFMLQAGQHRGLQVTIAPGSDVTPGPAIASSTAVAPSSVGPTVAPSSAGYEVAPSSPGPVVAPHQESLQ